VKAQNGRGKRDGKCSEIFAIVMEEVGFWSTY